MSELIKLAHGAINTFIHNPNQFASGGLLLMAVGSVAALFRQIPEKIWRWIVHQTTVTLSITDDQHAHQWFKIWIEQQRIMKRTRHMDVFNQGTEKYAMLPSPGHHWMLHKGRVLSITITRTEEKKLGQITRSETISFKTLGRSQKIFRDLMTEVQEAFIKQKEKKPELYVWGAWSEWLKIHSYQPRPLDSVLMPKGDKERLIQDIDAFRTSHLWYAEMGIPYRKGYLFYGLPGSGKTSLVTGLSSYYNSNVYMLKLADMSDSTLRAAIQEIEPNSFLIMEDIDCIKSFHSRKNVNKDDKATGVTLSGLLNIIDGMLSPSGAIFIMTTNHPEKLDPALIRPGRVDIKLRMGHATPSQKHGLHQLFFKADCPVKYLDKQMTMAELQQKLMEEKTMGSECLNQ